MAAITTSMETLSVREKVGYSLGDLAANLIFQTLITYLAFFYTDVYRIPAATAAKIIFSVGLLGAFVFTPVVGLLADRTRTRWASSGHGYCGRRFLSACCPCLLSARRTWVIAARSCMH